MVLITIVTGANLNQLITGGPHIVVDLGYFWSSPESEAGVLKAAGPVSLPGGKLSAKFCVEHQREFTRPGKRMEV